MVSVIIPNKVFFLYRFKIALLIIFFSFAQNVFAQSKTAEPYSKDEFPSVLHDLRRAEIITLGSMPFITLNTSLMYSFGKFAAHGFDASYFTNPFSTASDSSSYTQDEQVGIILTSIGVSLCIGITDFIVHSVKNSRLRKKAMQQKNKNITITPVSEDPDAVLLPQPDCTYEKGDNADD